MKQRFLVQSPYHPEEVSVLVHLYLELREGQSSFIRTRIMDMSRNVKRLNWQERHCVFLYGMCHLTSRETAALIGISHTHVITNYNSGRSNLIRLLNGGD